MIKTPALDLWRRELREGKRTPTTFDPLWRAACAEASALEFAGAGIPEIAESFRADARRIIHEAAEKAAKRQGGSAA
jgi:hypothetical protein